MIDHRSILNKTHTHTHLLQASSPAGLAPPGVLVVQEDPGDIPERQIRPKRVNEREVSSAALPQQKVAETLLSGGSKEEVDGGHAERILADL